MNAFIVLASVCLLALSCQKSFTPKPLNQGQLSISSVDIPGDSNTVTLSDAAQVAVGYLHARSPQSTFTVRRAETITDKAGNPYFHVIHCSDGFVVLSASKLYKAVLAYGYKGDFKMADMPTGVKRWLNTHAYYIKNIREFNNGRSSLDTIAAKKRQVYSELLTKFAPKAAPITKNVLAVNTIASPDLPPPPPPTITLDYYYYDTSTVGPLINSQWSQQCGFNDYCPPNSQGPCLLDVTGCLPLAMAQIVKYWHPNSSYLWSEMYDTDYAGNPAEAKLIDDIAETHISAGGNGPTLVSFGPTNSVGDDANAPYVFGQFGLNSTHSESIDDQIATGGKNGVQYEYLLVNELLYNQRPCMIGAYSTENDVLGVYSPSGTGHEWVCSGAQVIYEYAEYTETIYKFGGAVASKQNYPVFQDSTTYLYMSWGLGFAIDNGWFNCGIPGGYSQMGTTNYQYFQTVLYDIYP